MKLSVDFKSYSFDPLELSTGKIAFEFESGMVFPRSDFDFFVDYLLQDWLEGILHLQETREQGWYIFSFDNFCHEWCFEFNNEEAILILFKEDDEVKYSYKLSFNGILNLIKECIVNHLASCKSLGYWSDEHKELEVMIDQLK